VISGQREFRRWWMWRHSASETCHSLRGVTVCMQRRGVMENQHLIYSCGTNWNKKNIQTSYSVSIAVFVHCCVIEGDRK
jgi:hypothetical protein